LVIIAVVSSSLRAADVPDAKVGQFAQQLRELDARVIELGKVRQPPLAAIWSRDVASRLRLANLADQEAWAQVKNPADWERYRDVRLQALRTSLGRFPTVPKSINVRITNSHEGDGYRVENLVYESRPGLLVTANLYRPLKLGKSMPGILISHSHHNPKHVGWRQDMGMTWARAGCLVLVPDHLGHGERRQHPFAESNPHDYHFRYDASIQLYLVGESLMGWMAWDLMRGVDVLLAQSGIDPKRIILISEPSGGGDIAAVTAALDNRITGVLVNNFGGPQPETPYPLPKDAETSFAYAGSGSWESTRNLRRSASDGFLPWEIVAAVAPRRLIYYHEFYWDKEQDPVWTRLQKVWGFYGSADTLTGLAGRGFVVGSEPENTHWLAVSRESLYPTMERWFDIPNPRKEYSQRRPVEDLLCLTPALSKEMKSLTELTGRLADERSAAARQVLAKLTPDERRRRLRQEWMRMLGNVEPGKPVVKGGPVESQSLGAVKVERLQLGTEPGILVPALLLLPTRQPPPLGGTTVVIGIAQEGKQEFLRQRSAEIAELLMAGIAVCLPDLRGTGETSPGESRDRRSAATGLAASELMLGHTILGCRLRDLRALLQQLRQRSDVDARRLALWGDSFAPVNPPDRDLKVPHNAAMRPPQSEPTGGLLALLGALFEDDVKAVLVRNGLCDYHAVLDSAFCYLPFDAVVPGVLATGDLPDLASALAPRPLRIESMVDGLNRRVPAEALVRKYEVTRAGYRAANAAERLLIDPKASDGPPLARWLAAALSK
jgi:hypothetical protein